MLSRNVLIVLIVVCLSVVLFTGCQTSEPEVVEVEVTRIVEVPVEAEAAQAESAEAANVFPSFTTDVRTYHSEATGRDYTAYVTLPLSYGMAGQSYPVVYVTDGDFYTLPTAMTAGVLAFGQEMPEVITVGIGYGGSAMEAFERRVEDMAPEGTESFLQFLEEELIPDIEANYDVDPAVRTLMGDSLGAEFSLYALFNSPETFGQIIASSPSCGEGCAAMENAYAEGHDALPARLFVSAGDLDAEYLPGYEGLVEALEASDYEGLASELALLEGESHMSARPRAFTSGMRWVFSGEGG